MKSTIIYLFVVAFALSSCKEEPHLWKVDSEQQVIGDYIADNPDQFSEFDKLVKLAGMNSLLKIRGPFTVFIPTDEAMIEYYSYQSVSGLEDFDVDFLELLCRNHFIDNYIGSSDIGLGALSYVNGNGDYLTSEFSGSDIIISKSSKIINRDIYCSNGIVHVIDKVLDPVVQDIFSLVSSDPSYSIFSEGLSITGLKDTLQIISFPYGNGEARNRFTLLAVADSIYNRYGINTVDDLIEWCGANSDSVRFLENPFYRYMEYHCLNGSYYLSDLADGLYPILSRDNNVAITIDTEDYKINYDKYTKEYTGFNIPASNTPAKNGAMHSIDDLLPSVEPEPASVLFETTHFFDLMESDYYLNHYERFFDGENSFAKIKWEGNYLLYYLKPTQGGIIDNDCLSMRGWWSISVTFPKVMKGDYEVFIFQPGWTSTTDCKVHLDGVATKYTYTGPLGTGSGGLQKVADAHFETTAEHTITLSCTMPGALFWDYVEFVPVN